LKPDLVLVAILEGDDLQQTVAWHDRNLPGARRPPRPESSILESAKAFVRNRLFRNFLDSAPPLRSSVKDVWRPQARSLIDYVSRDERARFDALDEPVRTAFFDGTLNPITVHNAVTTPDYYTRAADPASKDAGIGIDGIAEALKSIRVVVARERAELRVVVVPYRAYVSPRDLPSLRRLGYLAPDSLASSD